MTIRVPFYDLSDDEQPVSAREFKIVVIGPRKAGKTSLIARIKSAPFFIHYTPTNAIEIHQNVCLGDIHVEIWDVPPNNCKFYRLDALRSDIILLVFDSNDGFDEAMRLLENLHTRLYTDITPQLWFVCTGQPHLVDVAHSDRLFFVDNVSREGILDLIYDVRCTMI
tara:strand:+ start:565 stop:1065 length:501 start_codon:yes stop_codon:yes gene_type:complete